MSKPHAAPEPTMEDILASIRKMISEDRLGPRPIPDQIARTSIGERAPAPPAVKSTSGDQPELPRTPEVSKASEPIPPPAPADAGSELSSAERPVPSFSSLSDALKSVAPNTAGRRSFDDKIAGMLDEEEVPRTSGRAPASSRAPSAGASPLAVFSGSRPAPPTAGAQPPRYGVGTGLPRSAPELPELPERGERMQPASGSRSQPPLKPVPEIRAKPAQTNTTQTSSSGNGSGPNGSAHNGAAAQNGSGLNGSGLNGSAHKAPAQNAAGAAAKAAPAPMPEATAEKPAAKAGEPAQKPTPAPSESATTASTQKAPERKDSDVRESAPAADAGSKAAAAAAKPANERIIAMPGRFPASGAQAESKGGAAEALADARASVFGLRPASTHSSATGASLSEGDQKPVKSDAITPDAIESPSAPLKAEVAKSIPILSEAATQEALAEFIGPPPKPEIKSEIKEPAEALQALKAAVAAPSVDVIAVAQPVVSPPVVAVAAHVPSESLIDAVMNLVQEQPSALSVFTSGADFIHGIHSAHESGSHAAPESGATAGQAATPEGTQKLDASAAELLRPMLRQWLAENMGRILEEALRSELKSSQKAGATTSDKA